MSRKTDNRSLSGWLQAFLQIDEKKAKDIIAVAHGSRGTQKIQVKPMLAFLQRVRNLRTQDFKKHRQLTRYFKILVNKEDKEDNEDKPTLRFITLMRLDLLQALRESHDILASVPLPRRRKQREQRQSQLERVDALIQYFENEPLLAPIRPNADIEEDLANLMDEMPEPPSQGYDDDDLHLALPPSERAKLLDPWLDPWALERNGAAINATTSRNDTDFRDDPNQDGLMAELAKLANGSANLMDEMPEPSSASGAAAMDTTQGYDDDLDLVLEDLEALTPPDRGRLLNLLHLERNGAAINATTPRNDTVFRDDPDDPDDPNQDGLMAELAKGSANTFQNPLRL